MNVINRKRDRAQLKAGMVRTAILCLMSLAVPCASAALRVQPDEENVVGSRLFGHWQPHPGLNDRLEGRVRGTISFETNATVAGSIPAKHNEFLEDKRIFLAGTMVRPDGKFAFVLIEHRGNPHVVYFRERDGDPFADAESFNLVVVVAKDPKNDLLFIGGDFNNQPFGAYGRAPKEEP